MRRRSWVVGLSLAFAACYEVGDLREQDDAGSGGSANSSGSGGGWSATGGVGGVGGASGGTSGSGGSTPEDAASEQPGSGGASGSGGAGGAVEDAGSNDSSSSDAGAKDADASPPDPWHACKPLGYAGQCLDGEVVIYFNETNDCGTTPSNTCILNICGKKGGVCTAPGKCGYLCDPNLVDGEEDACLPWGTNGRCVANAAIRANAAGTDCEFKDCTKLGKTCTGGISVPADCI